MIKQFSTPSYPSLLPPPHRSQELPGEGSGEAVPTSLDPQNNQPGCEAGLISGSTPPAYSASSGIVL
jgi:hypothetical protein